MTTEPRILKRAPIGWNQDNYDVLEDGVIVGRIFKVPIAPQDRPWMWASGHNGHSATSGNSTTFYDYGANHRPRDHHQHWHDLLQQQGPDHWPSEPMRMTTEEYTWMLSELSKLSANDLTRLPRSRAAPRMGRAVPLQDQGTSS